MSAPYRVARGDSWELRHGDYREVLGDVWCDALITDPPFSERTHAGNNASDLTAKLDYAPYTDADVAALVEFFAAVAPGGISARTRGWCVVFCDHVLARSWEHHLYAAGLYTFAPLPCVVRGQSFRFSGDGPSSWTTWIVVARPRTQEFARWGTLPGAYTGPPARTEGRVRIGGKPLSVMRSLVRDYSRRGDLICDPCAGHGTTLMAAVHEGRRAIGAEIDREAFEMAAEKLSRGYTREMEFG